MSTTKFVFNPFTSNFDEIVNTIDLTTDVTGILPIANGGTNISIYTTGDTLYASASNVLSKLPIGSSNQVLTVAAGLPSWSTPFSPQASVTLYVDVNRTDTYTADGNIGTPFKSITAAINQVISNNDGRNYLILVQPGTYTENITLNSTALNRIAIVASSVSDGYLSNDALPVTSIVGNIISNASNDNLKVLIIRGFDIQGVVNLTGASNGTSFLQFGGTISDCILYSNASPAITAVNAGQIVFNGLGSAIASGSGGITVTNVINFLAYSSFLNLGNTTITTNGGGNKPSGFSATNCQFSYGSLAGATTIDASSTVTHRYERITSTLSLSGTLTSVVSTYLGTVTVNSGGVWNSNGDIVNNTPSNSGTITQTGKLQASGANLSSLTASQPVKTDANKYLVSGLISLTTDVSGILPIANGGTGNSSGTATINANMTGDVTSVGNATTYNNTVPTTKGGTGLTSYTTGDTLYASASNVLSKLPIGSTNQVLTVVAGIPAWTSSTNSTAEYLYQQPAGNGSNNTQVRYYTNLQLSSDVSSLLNVSNVSTTGLTITVLKPCMISISATDQFSANDNAFGIVKNGTEATTSIFSITNHATVLALTEIATGGFSQSCSATATAAVNDVFWCQNSSAGVGGNPERNMLYITARGL